MSRINEVFKFDEKEEPITIKKEKQEIIDESNVMYDKNIVLMITLILRNVMLFFL